MALAGEEYFQFCLGELQRKSTKHQTDQNLAGPWRHQRWKLQPGSVCVLGLCERLWWPWNALETGNTDN